MSPGSRWDTYFHVKLLKLSTTGQLYSLHGSSHVRHHRLEEQPRVPQPWQAHLLLPSRLSADCRASFEVDKDKLKFFSWKWFIKMGNDLKSVSLSRNRSESLWHFLSSNWTLHQLADWLLGCHGDCTQVRPLRARWPHHVPSITILKPKQIKISLRRQLAADKDLITSVRWLSMDKKNGFRNLSVKLLKSIGLMKPGEDLDPESVKTKIVFAVCQLVNFIFLNFTFRQLLNVLIPSGLYFANYSPYSFSLRQLQVELCISSLHIRMGNLERSKLLYWGLFKWKLNFKYQ